MTVKILVKNIANTYSEGDAILIYKDIETPGRYELKSKFIADGLNPDDWPRQFFIVNVSDAAKGDYDYLLEDNEEGRRYNITPQGPDSPFYESLLEHAEITVVKAILDPLIIDRGA